MSLIGIIQAIQDTVGAVTGIRAAPDYPPENLNSIFPFSVCYPESGTYTEGPGGVSAYKALHNIKLQIHFGRADLPKSVEAAIPYGDLIAKALLIDPQINDSCDTFDEILYTFGPLAWGEPAIPTIGWDFTLTNVKEIESTT
jgi:hypothetical protein